LTVSRLEDLTVDAILDAMPPPPTTTTTTSTAMVRSSSDASDREKELPLAPGPVSRTSSEAATYVTLRGPPDFGDPQTRSEQREVARRAAEAEARATRREEAARQARIKSQRLAEAQEAEAAERSRRAQLERDLARKAAARTAREEMERAEEERRAREREERKRRGAEKRAETVRKFEEWKLEETRRREEQIMIEEELKRRANERREAARDAAAKRRRESHFPGDSVLLTGWVTVQPSESIAWRRRYFQLTDTVLRLYNQEKVRTSFIFIGAERDGSLNERGHNRTLMTFPRTSSCSRAQVRPSRNGTKVSRNYARSRMHSRSVLPMASLQLCFSPTLLKKRCHPFYPL
jgi:hypothetical protein